MLLKKERKNIIKLVIWADNNIIKREFGAYDNIKDNYPKYVISMDKFDMFRNYSYEHNRMVIKLVQHYGYLLYILWANYFLLQKTYYPIKKTIFSILYIGKYYHV